MSSMSRINLFKMFTKESGSIIIYTEKGPVLSLSAYQEMKVRVPNIRRLYGLPESYNGLINVPFTLMTRDEIEDMFAFVKKTYATDTQKSYGKTTFVFGLDLGEDEPLSASFSPKGKFVAMVV